MPLRFLLARHQLEYAKMFGLLQRVAEQTDRFDIFFKVISDFLILYCIQLHNSSGHMLNI